MTPLLSSALSGTKGVAHGFFDRQGGVSTGIYASLNCGYGSSDDPASVRENRSRVAQALGTDVDRLLTVYQIHSAEAVHVTAPWERGDAPKADAMATKVPGIALGVLAADCAPLLLADPEACVVGAAHAGWKGALGGIVESVVALMEALGANRSRICAAVGPCIHQPAYEVGPEFRERFIADDVGNARYFVPSVRPAHWQFDLPGYVSARATALGLAAVDRLQVCTYANPERYFSFRRTTHRSEPDYGRNLSAIVIAP